MHVYISRYDPFKAFEFGISDLFRNSIFVFRAYGNYLEGLKKIVWKIMVWERAVAQASQRIE